MTAALGTRAVLYHGHDPTTNQPLPQEPWGRGEQAAPVLGAFF